MAVVTPIVLDASVTMSWCFADESNPYGHGVLALLRDSWAEVPSLWPLEVANVLLMSERRGRITAQGAEEFLAALALLDIRIDSEIQQPAKGALLALARRHRLTAYDAAYLELAMRRGLPLASLDRALMAAASSEGVGLISRS